MPIIGAILGATGSGKTEIAVLLAQKLGAEIICMDSRQIYKGFRIGTAQPEAEILHAAVHHLVDFLPPEQQYNAAEFAKDVKSLLLQKPDAKFILVGGTGLYMQALCKGLNPLPPSNPEIREKLKKQYENKSKQELYSDALKAKPDIEGKIMPGDTQRLLRVLELKEHILIENGELRMENNSSINAKFSNVGLGNSQFSILNSQLSNDGNNAANHRVGGIGSIPCVWLDFARDELYRRINERVVRMLKNGWAEEVSELSKTVPAHAPAWQSLGYLALKNALEKNEDPFSIAEKVAMFSRHYAKRQITWFKHKENPVYIDGKNAKENLEMIIQSFQ